MAGKFEPKVPVTLDPPKDDPISVEELAKADGGLPSIQRLYLDNYTESFLYATRETVPQ